MFLGITLGTWATILGAVVCGIIGVRSLIRYHKARTELSRYIGWLFILFAIPYAISPWFELAHPKAETARAVFLFSEIISYAGYLVQVRLMFFISDAKNKLYLWLLMVGTILLVSAGWIIEYLLVKVDVMKHPLEITTPHALLYVQDLLYAFILLPVGYFFVKQGLRQSSFRSKFKSLSIGGGYFVVTLLGLYANLFNRGYGYDWFTYLYIVTAIVILVALLMPGED